MIEINNIKDFNNIVIAKKTPFSLLDITSEIKTIIFNNALEQNNQLLLGICYFLDYDYINSFRCLFDIKQKNPVAQYCLGMIYNYGIIISNKKERQEQAIYWLTLSANKNYSSAKTQLALIYKNDNSLALLEEAAQIDPEAQYLLGIHYLYKNKEKANYYFSLAEKNNYQKAIIRIQKEFINENMIYFKYMLDDSYKEECKYYYKIIQKLKRAIKILANSKNTDDYIFLGNLYYESIDYHKIYEEKKHPFKHALKWYLKAMNDQKSIDNTTKGLICKNIGRIYSYNETTFLDIKKAIWWFDRGLKIFNNNPPENFINDLREAFYLYDVEDVLAEYKKRKENGTLV